MKEGKVREREEEEEEDRLVEAAAAAAAVAQTGTQEQRADGRRMVAVVDRRSKLKQLLSCTYTHMIL